MLTCNAPSATSLPNSATDVRMKAIITTMTETEAKAKFEALWNDAVAVSDKYIETIQAHGAVSAQVAVAMAEGARARLGADLVVAVTGVAHDPGSAETVKEAASTILRYSFMGTNDATAVLGRRRRVCSNPRRLT